MSYSLAHANGVTTSRSRNGDRETRTGTGNREPGTSVRSIHHKNSFYLMLGLGLAI